MWLADNWKEYQVIDCSEGEKLERWGKYTLLRPDPQVIWNTKKEDKHWKHLNAHYHRSKKVAESGSFLIFQSSGIFIIEVLPSI